MISFIVPAHNEERLLAPTLEAIHAAGRECGEEYELIVVNDSSTDRTPEIAAEHGAQVVSVEHRQIAATRNAGARVAKGDVLLFVDADTLVSPATVKAARRAVDAGCVGGSARIKFEEGVPLAGRIAAAMFLFAYYGMGLGAGCFFFATRAAFDRVGGFNEEYFAAEETWLSIALKRIGKFVILREPVTTSGRKFHQYKPRELMRPFVRAFLMGPRALRERDALWYGERRG